MSTESLCIHVLWASVVFGTLIVLHKCVEKYTAVKSAETLVLATEKFSVLMLHILKKNGNVLTNGSRRSTPAYSQVQKDDNLNAAQDALFDLRS